MLAKTDSSMAGSKELTHNFKGERKMINLKDIITNEKAKGVIALAAAVVMWFTPDYVDAIIEAGLAAIGISKLVIKKEQ
jgi:hypothetical protein